MILTGNEKIENGFVMGYVETNKVGSDCEYEICTVKEYIEASEDEFNKILVEAMWESGYIEIGLAQ